ncbi:MAG: hypothetical protein AAGA77_09885 [Bacteroidota bacterium]
MVETKLIIAEAQKGNELPFDAFFKKTFFALQKQLVRMTGSENEARILFVEAMEKFWDRFVIAQKELPDNIKGYIFMICKNLWLIQKRDPWNKVTLYDTYQENWKVTEDNSPLDGFTPAPSLSEESLEKGLNALGEKCKTLLLMSMDASIKLIDHQKRLGYATYQAMIQAKYNCKKRLIKEVMKAMDDLKKSRI